MSSPVMNRPAATAAATSVTAAREVAPAAKAAPNSSNNNNHYRSGLTQAFASSGLLDNKQPDNLQEHMAESTGSNIHPLSPKMLLKGTEKVPGIGITKCRPPKSASPLSSAALESAGVITPILLAKHHLPDIVLNYGPLSLRHIMAYLTTSVPGFSGVPLTKQRRLVLNALESGTGGGGINGEVVFEKVGAGRWSARVKDGFTYSSSHIISPEGHRSLLMKPGVETAGSNSMNWRPESGVFLQDEDVDGVAKVTVDDHEDTEMIDFASSSECITQETATDNSAIRDDSTDEEDWASIGAEAVRNGGSMPSIGQGQYFGKRPPNNIHGNIGLARSLPGERGDARKAAQPARVTGESLLDPRFPIRAKEEQEAVEALVRLGSF